MKKLITVTLLLLAALTTQAQSLIGTWQAPMEVEGEEVTLVVTFNADKSPVFEIQTSVNSEELGFMKFCMIGEMGDKAEFNIDKVTPTTLELSDDDQSMTFTRIKK